MSRLTVRAFALMALTLAVARPAPAQGWLHKLKEKAKEKAAARLDTATDAALDTAANRIEHVIKCAVSNTACIRQAAAAGQAVLVTDDNGAPVSSADSAAAIASAMQSAPSATPAGAPVGAAPVAGGAGAGQAPGTGVWLNYDFVPGDKVLFYDDFADDHVGDLPSHEDVTDGNVTVVDVGGTKYLRTVTGATLWITLPQKLPERFTIEATYFNPHDNNALQFTVGDDHAVRVWCFHSSAGISGEGASGDKRSQQDATGIGAHDFVNCRFMFDRGYVKAYLNEQRLAQLNGLTVERGAKVRMQLPSGYEDEGATLVTGIRIAEGGRPLYQALAANGRVSTHGILFATGSATIEGESTPTLKEIGEMLQAHPDLRLTIEGHTDNVGDAAANQTLSEQRAAAVAQYLESTYHIDAGRLATKGYGAAKPVASNDTPEGRQQNRRVELVRM